MHRLKECLTNKSIADIMKAQNAVIHDVTTGFLPVADHHFLQGEILS